MKKVRFIHFVGIKGVGMTPLAIIAKEAGITVTGSDVADEFITDEALSNASISVSVGFNPAHIGDADLVITTGAHGGFDNPEVKEAKKRGIPVMTKGEAVGAYMSGAIFGRSFEGIAVAGTHGKTTTTAIVATILNECGLDPSYIIGTSTVKSLGKPGHFGRGKYFVAEADEYATEPQYDKKPQFLWQQPKIGIITNIELDHVDMYPDVSAVEKAFKEFADKIPDTGVLIACGDDYMIRTMLQTYKKRAITYGFSPQNDYVISRSTTSEEQSFFRVQTQGVELGEFVTYLFGEHNMLNALAGIIVALEVGIPIEKIKKALRAYAGSKRRFERLGKTDSGALLYDDYAHHPTEIKKTLKAFRQMYPRKRIICLFQPHTYSRTKRLFADFLSSFTDADQVVISDVYASKREAMDPTVSSRMLATEMKKFHKNVVHIPTVAGMVEYIRQNKPRGDAVIVLMGAGDIYKISEHLDLIHES